MRNEDQVKEWRNWSESIRFTPAAIELPANEAQLQEIVAGAYRNKRTLRTVGASHSCSGIFATHDTLISMENFKGQVLIDPVNLRANVSAAMTVEEIGELLFKQGLGMENTGHINKQRIAGAVSTGTHGAGKRLHNLSGQLYGVRLVNGTGDIREFNEDDDPQMMQALKVSLGALGVFTQVTLKVLPAFRLRRRQYCAALNDCLNALDQMMDENRNFCFYWYPRRDDVSIRTWNFEEEHKSRLPFGKIYKESTGWGKDVLPTEQKLKYNELEYSVDAAVAVDCFQEIRKRILEKYRKLVAWRVLFRPVAPDNVMLSNAYKRESVAITVHQNATLPYKEYFDDIESIFQSFGGRPHWGKKHAMRAKDLELLYPEWENFQRIRREMDPGNIFLNDYLKRIFIYDHGQ